MRGAVVDPDLDPTAPPTRRERERGRTGSR
jgi:hypothetical protein